jgi:hypothetical protein
MVKKCGSIEAAWRVTYISPCILRIPGINGIMRKEKVSHGSSLHHHSAFHLHCSPPPYLLYYYYYYYHYHATSAKDLKRYSAKASTTAGV